MPFIRFTASERHTRVVTIILLLGEIMPTCSYCVLKGLVYVIITALSSHQPSSCSKYIKSICTYLIMLDWCLILSIRTLCIFAF